MANKQEKAVQRAVAKAEKQDKVREEKHVLWFLVALILLLLWLLFAQHNGWWPYSRPLLGSAFYTNIGANTPVPSADDGNSDSTGNAGSNGSNGTNGSSGSNGSNGTSTTTPAASKSLIDFAGQVNVGDTKAQVNGQANGLSQGCAVVANVQAQVAGKQEVCTYTEGDKIVTVTYLNDRVVSASKSGF